MSVCVHMPACACVSVLSLVPACVCACVCVCVWGGGGGGDCSLLPWQPKFQRPVSLSTSGLGNYKVARVGRPATDYKKLSDFGKVTFDHASYATFPQSCMCVCVCV